MSKSSKGKPGDPVIENRKARHRYTISDTLEVGIALRGSEVKSIREGKASIGEGYVRAEESPPGLFLHGMHIDEYGPASGVNQHKPVRVRALLAHKREILKLLRETSEKGVTLAPLKIYFKNGRAKLLIGVARGKAMHDKRRDIKERDAQRDIQRAMSRKV